MATKKKPTKVKSLKTKSVSGGTANRVKGGSVSPKKNRFKGGT